MLLLLSGGLSLRVKLSKSSAAFPVNTVLGGAAFVAKDILSGERAGWAKISTVEDASRNGFRDRGRGGGSKGERWPSDNAAGEAARFRKGLLDDRFCVSPGDGDGRKSA